MSKQRVILLGKKSDVDRGKPLPWWLDKYLIDHPKYRFGIPWDKNTGKVLRSIIERSINGALIIEARRGLEAWEGWSGRDHGEGAGSAPGSREAEGDGRED